MLALCLIWLAAVVSPGAARAADMGFPTDACQALQTKYPQFKGKTLVDAVNPHTPGYEALDPKDPSKYVGFDIDLAESLGKCLGFSLTYKPVAFAALLPTLRAGQADIVISDIYATSKLAKAADFITYSKVFDGVLVAKGNPKGINGINTSMCGTTAAENTGFVEVPLVQNLAAACKKEGKPAPKLQLYNNNAQCIQAVLAGRADNTGKLSKAVALTLPYSVGIAVPKHKHEFRGAIREALVTLQKAGVEKTLLTKWSLGAGHEETPRLVTH
ncbi:MAG: ABC transporter substrate-binding protein [Gammaproteobacteria bacterium]